MMNNSSILFRYLIVIIIMGFACVCILTKAGIIMFGEREYWKRVADRFVRDSVEVKPTRGNILSADGQLMASSLPEYKIYMDFMVSKKQNETEAEKARREKEQHQKDSLLYANLDSICRGMHRIFPDKSVAEFKAHIKKGRKKESRNYLLYPRRISYIQYKEVKKLPIFCLNKYKGGFHGQTFNQRKKPFGSLARYTLGDVYAAKDAARYGLELSFDSLLRGTPGITHRQKVMNKYLSIEDRPPVDGCDIVSTLDVDMQDIAETALVEQLINLGTANVGVAVVMEVATGDVKAIVNMTKCSDGKFREVYSNAISDMMEPGSVFKTASIMVALEDGVIDTTDVVDTGNGTYRFYNRVMKDHNWYRGGYQKLTIPQVLMVSSNIGVSRVIEEHYRNNPQKFVDGLYRTGLPTKLNLQIGGEGTPYIRKPGKRGWSKTSLAWMSIGYETLIPPISTLTFYNAIANNGVMVKPRFVTSVLHKGETVKEYPVEVLNPKICSDKTLKKIQCILEEVVSRGLGKAAGSDQFHVSGKTGTAQVATGGHYQTGAKYLVSFCGYFPSENPKYSCIVAIQKTGLPASGGLQAGSVFKRIAERVYAKDLSASLKNAVDSNSVFIPEVKSGDIVATQKMLKTLNVPVRCEVDTESQKGPVWGHAQSDVHNVRLYPSSASKGTVPNVIGMGAKDATYLLEECGLKVKIEGIGEIESQTPCAGTPLKKGETVTLYLTSK